MAHIKDRRINARIKEGSALERLILASPHKTVSGALHDIAAAYEAIKAKEIAGGGG